MLDLLTNKIINNHRQSRPRRSHVSVENATNVASRFQGGRIKWNKYDSSGVDTQN